MEKVRADRVQWPINTIRKLGSTESHPTDVRHGDVRNRVFGKNPVSGGGISIAIGCRAKVLRLLIIGTYHLIKS
ncbi:MAG: hypothetical protein SXA11_10040 [Cyanobacteriota bacterium]|nr:hypothetical protein [Cyanobacteriota bacterium]